MSKTDHLARAKDYIARGEDCYRKAAEEIVAAMQGDSTLSQQAIADRVGKSRAWVRDLVHWHTSGRPGVSPFSAESQGREKGADPVMRAQRTMREADDETMEEIVSALPDEQRSKLITAAANVPRAEGGDLEAEMWKSVQDAPKSDLSAQAAKLVATASQVEVLLTEGAEFRRMDARELQRLRRDLDRVKDTADRLQEQIDAQGRVRRIA